MHSKIPCFFVAWIFLAAAGHACAAQGKPAASTAGALTAAGGPETTTQAVDRPELHRRNPRYQLCKDDVLQLNFALTPDLNQTVSVQPDGYITLLGVGDLHVEGQTIPEVTESIRLAYAKTLHNAIITVRLMDFEKPYFIVGGQVGHPGKFELRGDTTLTEAVAIAGGFTQQAKHSQVVLFRRVSLDVAEAHLIDVKKMLNSRTLAEDWHLRPGDFIFVPQSRISKVRKFVPASAMNWYLNPLQF